MKVQCSQVTETSVFLILEAIVGSMRAEASRIEQLLKQINIQAQAFETQSQAMETQAKALEILTQEHQKLKALIQSERQEAVNTQNLYE